MFFNLVKSILFYIYHDFAHLFLIKKNVFVVKMFLDSILGLGGRPRFASPIKMNEKPKNKPKNKFEEQDLNKNYSFEYSLILTYIKNPRISESYEFDSSFLEDELKSLDDDVKNTITTIVFKGINHEFDNQFQAKIFPIRLKLIHDYLRNNDSFNEEKLRNYIRKGYDSALKIKPMEDIRKEYALHSAPNSKYH